MYELLVTVRTDAVKRDLLLRHFVSFSEFASGCADVDWNVGQAFDGAAGVADEVSMSVTIGAGGGEFEEPAAIVTADSSSKLLADERVQRAVDGDEVGVGRQLGLDVLNAHRPLGRVKAVDDRDSGRRFTQAGRAEKGRGVVSHIFILCGTIDVRTMESAAGQSAGDGYD